MGLVGIMPLDLKWFDEFLDQHPSAAVVEHEEIFRPFDHHLPSEENKNEWQPCEIHLAFFDGFDRPNEEKTECQRKDKTASKEYGVWS